MMKTIVPLVSLLLVTACAESSGNDDGLLSDQPTFNACDSAYPGVPRVVAAYLKRIERAKGGPEVTDPLLASARAAVDTPEVEQARERHAGDYLIRGYLAPFMELAGVAPAEWLYTLPDGELTAEQVSEAGARALVLLHELRAGLPSAFWLGGYDAFAGKTHAAILNGIPGVPSGWYGADTVFRATWDAALIAGFQAGEAAWQYAPKRTVDEQQAAVSVAIQVTLRESAAFFVRSEASTLAEARALIAMQ